MILTLFSSSNFALAKLHEISKTDSQVKWQGSKTLGKHTGNVVIKEAKVDIDDRGMIKEAEIAMDMTQISSDDLQGDSWSKLISHLNSENFFHTGTFKTASFSSKSIKKLDDNKYEFKGNLNIKGISKPLSFVGNYSRQNKKHKLIGEFIFSRKDYKIRYGSGKFLSKFGDRLIHDDVLISFDLVTK